MWRPRPPRSGPGISPLPGRAVPRDSPSLSKRIILYLWVFGRAFNRATAGGTMNRHVSQVWLKQWKVYSHPPSLISPFPISPSLIPPSANLPLVFLVSLIILKQKNSLSVPQLWHTHRHTNTQTKYRSRDKYMINWQSWVFICCTFCLEKIFIPSYYCWFKLKITVYWQGLAVTE